MAAPNIPSTHRQVLIDSLPEGRLAASNFAVSTGPVPSPGDGEVLCRTLAITIGAGQRAGLQGSASYAGAPEAGRVMGGTGIAEVVAGAGSLKPGDLIWVQTGWQEYSVQRAAGVRAIDPTVSPADHLGLLGLNGLTAYFGVTDVGRVQPGETFLV